MVLEAHKEEQKWSTFRISSFLNFSWKILELQASLDLLQNTKYFFLSKPSY